MRCCASCTLATGFRVILATKHSVCPLPTCPVLGRFFPWHRFANGFVVCRLSSAASPEASVATLEPQTSGVRCAVVQAPHGLSPPRVMPAPSALVFVKDGQEHSMFLNTVAHFWSIRNDAAHMSPMCRRHACNLTFVLAISAEFGPMLSKYGPLWANWGQIRPTVCLSLTKISRI